MLWDHTAYCRRCRRRVFVAPRRYSLAGDRLLMAVTLGLWALMRRWRPRRFGLWQCDECGSYACVAARRVKLDEQGRRVRVRKRRSRRSTQGAHRHQPR